MASSQHKGRLAGWGGSPGWSWWEPVMSLEGEAACQKPGIRGRCSSCDHGLGGVPKLLPHWPDNWKPENKGHRPSCPQRLTSACPRQTGKCECPHTTRLVGGVDGAQPGCPSPGVGCLGYTKAAPCLLTTSAPKNRASTGGLGPPPTPLRW